MPLWEHIHTYNRTASSLRCCMPASKAETTHLHRYTERAAHRAPCAPHPPTPRPPSSASPPRPPSRKCPLPAQPPGPRTSPSHCPKRHGDHEGRRCGAQRSEHAARHAAARCKRTSQRAGPRARCGHGPALLAAPSACRTRRRRVSAC
ncbi:uncharacterized protein TRAVEDRAFT_32440 [Trametes versicolor FP-101664 SS1]|uniref:Uncharacterized protein n=1 Tax=Trametes versicolor (strain FP-101664) TaxID=717944 RepID=R7S6M2_TRAVS|nr:uncharacterized protein TRAVEDRAFT_32440 [Trametes versicolor FP-101664 SS1]EIW51551.1 hypothetical protein TRAVEDRAFT_32440 [Trametes versicolor FP-101664 SS1]